ncbi:DNA polymerase phi-domain-containing protein, partial [Xylariaceae sp. FL0016]
MAKRKRGSNKQAGVTANQPNQKRPKTDHPTENGVVSKELELDRSPFTEEKKGENQKRVAKTYDLLGSADEIERIAAAEAVVTALLAGTETVLQHHLEKRLIRGLASSRNASRLGFSLALAEILSQLFGPNALQTTKYPDLTFDKTLGILRDTTKTTDGMPGQEKTDFYFGRLFGLQCFVDAKILFTDEKRWEAVLDMLLHLTKDRASMRSHCAWVIVQSLPQMGQARAENTLQRLVEEKWGKTAEGVGIWLRARSCYPALKVPTKPWQDPLSPGVLPEVARVLKEMVAQDTGDDAAVAKMKQSNWSAQLHFVWDLILENFIVQQSKDQKQCKDALRLFWTTVVDDGLYSKNASDGQKFRGFMIFQKFFSGLVEQDKSLVKELFSRNFMRCLVNQASKEDRYLHRAALKSLQCVEKAVEAAPDLLITVLKELMGKFGGYDFDQRTNTKTIENLLQWATPRNSKKVLTLLREPVLDIKEASESERFRQAYADYVFKLAIQSKVVPISSEDTGSKSVLEVAMKELISCAYSKQEDFRPDLSDKSREVFRRRVASAFAKLAKHRENTEYLCDAVVSLQPTAVAMSEEIQNERKAALKATKKLLKSQDRSDDSHASPSTGLALLYATALIQLYDGAPDAISILQDLQGCSEKMKSKDSGISELLVEILLALISRQSPMLRQISEQVVEGFASYISREALELLTEPLLAEENSRGYQALFENAEDEDVDMDDAGESEPESEESGDNADEDDISEIGSDVEFVTLNGAEPATDEEDNDEESESEGDEQAEAQAQELANLDDALAKVLKSHRLDKDENAQSSDDDSDMTDSEMMALDDKLVEVFKQRVKTTSKKKDKKDEKDLIVTFKHRVLDLLHIYVKQEASNTLALNLLLPLLQLIRTTTAKPLANKAASILVEFSKASKKTRNKDATVDVPAQLELLDKIHEEALKDPAHALAKAASTSSLMIASNLFAASEENANAINAVYAETFSKCQKNKIKVQGVLFTDWVNWGMGHANNKAD